MAFFFVATFQHLYLYQQTHKLLLNHDTKSPSMELPHFTVCVSLLLLSFGRITLACVGEDATSEPLSRENFCELQLFTFNDSLSICQSEIYQASHQQNSIGARNEALFGADKIDTEKDSTEFESPLYIVTPVSGKGLGVLAKVPIPRGTKIILEAPLISIPMPALVAGQGFPLADMLSAITTSFTDLPPSSQHTFHSLHDHRFPGDEEGNLSHLLTIFRSNAYNTGTDHVGLFPRIARINHSCKPNSVNYWSERMDKRIIYAGGDIQKGEEITVSYIPLLKSTRERQQRLVQYGFVCTCRACKDEESSKRRGKIGDLMEVLEQKKELKSEKKLVNERLAKRAEKLIGMVREEGLVDYLAKSYHLAAVFQSRAMNMKGAKRWSEKEIEERKLAEEDSEEIDKAFELFNRLFI